MEALFKHFPIWESILAGVLLSLIISAIKPLFFKGRKTPNWLVAVIGLFITFLFINLEAGTFGSVPSIQQFFIQFLVIFSVAALFYKTAGKAVVDKFISFLVSKFTGELDKNVPK